MYSSAVHVECWYHHPVDLGGQFLAAVVRSCL